MSQRNVEQVIGRLVTDQAFRRRFAADPGATVDELVAEGLELNVCERRALATLDFGLVTEFADRIDPCLQKIELRGGRE
jgi:hypothetical protein